MPAFLRPCVVSVLVFNACAGGLGATGSTSSSNEDVIAGITIPNDTPVCTMGGQFTAVASQSDVTFQWSDHASATQWAVKMTKAPSGATSLTTLLDRLQEKATRTVSAGERETGTSYRVTVVALDGTTPKCIVDGVNGATP